MSRSIPPHCRRARTSIRCLLALGLTLLGLLSWIGIPSRGLATRPSRSNSPRAGNKIANNGNNAVAETERARIVEAYGKLPLSFERNEGQAGERADVGFFTRGRDYNLYLTPTEAVLRLRIADCGSGIGKECSGRSSEPLTAGLKIGNPQSAISNQRSAVLRMSLVGGNVKPEMTGASELAGKSNYFVGNDPKKWRTNVPHFAKVEYEEVYPGVDLVYYGNQRQLEYDFRLAPGTDPNTIRLGFRGAQEIRVDEESGDLVFAVAGGELRQLKPVVYQETNQGRREIQGRYRLLETPKNNRATHHSAASTHQSYEVGFEVGEYDQSLALVIDPVLSYSTFLGGTGAVNDEIVSGIAVDSFGNAYVTGLTDSANFPTTAGAFDTSLSNNDAFVTKLNATGTALIYSTYLGGGDSEGGAGIALDAEGYAYVTGSTISNDFPIVNGFKPTNPSGGGDSDGYLAKLNPTGSAILYSTYIGGNIFDSPEDVAVDSAGNAYVVGSTDSADLLMNPTPPVSFDNTTDGGGGGFFDGFLFKVDTRASGAASLVYGTYVGGLGDDFARAVAVDVAGNACVVGSTEAGDFPTFNPQDGTIGGTRDNFVFKLNAPGTALVFSTYLGGSSSDSGDGVALDPVGNIYVAGATNSTDFPVSGAPAQGALSGLNDATVTKYSPTGVLSYATYLGGSGSDFASDIAVDSHGNAYVAGGTDSTDFPAVNAFQGTLPGGIANPFVTKVGSTGSSFVYSTYLGATSSSSNVNSIAVDSFGNAYVGGGTTAADFPVTAGAFDTTIEGPQDGFVAKLSQFGSCAFPDYAPSTGSPFAAGTGVSSAAIGDFNEDGNQDLATANLTSDDVSVLLGDGAGGFGAPTNFGAGNTPVSIAVGDFNEDGNLDLAAANQNTDDVSVFLGNGAGSFGAATSFAAGSAADTVAVGDFNVDGNQDLAVVNANDANVSILLGNGAGSFGAASNFAVGTTPRGMAVGDFNLDGNQDLAVSNQTTDNVSILLGNGTGGFGAATNFVVGDNPNSVAVGDFDGDGDPDLAVANVNSDNASILLGNGAGSFGAATNFAAGDAPFAIAVSDLNGDGKSDIATDNANSNNVSVLLGNGAGGFGAANSFNTGGAVPIPVAVGDFNNDTRPDLAVGGFSSNDVSILLSGCGSPTAANTIAVNTTTDADDGACTALGTGNGCTLREAINAANALAGTDTITFNIAGADVHTISPTSALPTITGPVTIDGYTQPGASANTLATGSNAVLQIELSGASAGASVIGLNFNGASNSTVRGLVINNFGGGGSEAIRLGGAGSNNDNTVAGCFIGTNVAGTAIVSNDVGVAVNGSDNNTIGGATPAARNLISGNLANGIQLFFADGNAVQGNLIGTDAAGTGNLGNQQIGIGVNGSNNRIGGTASGARNVIAFTGAQDGVQIDSGTGNAILSNSIFGNGGLGIDLSPDGVNANDAGDADTGANNLQNFPILSSATTFGTNTAVAGTLNSTASTVFTLQFFANTACDASGNGEGQQFLGSTSVVTDGAGNATFDTTLMGVTAAGTVITATATDPSGNTSEFSACQTATPVISCGAASFAVPVTFFVAGTNPFSMAVGDFDGDGDLDLAVANAGSSNVSVLLGDGAGGFGPATNFGVGLTPVSVAVGDFDGDGDLDLAVANRASANVSILLGTGTGSFGAATNFGSTNPVSVAVGDFNGDGNLDLAAANRVSNNVSILLGNGVGGFGVATNFGVGTDPSSVAVGDFNGDSKQDLVVANSTSNNVSVLLGTGTGSFGAATNFGAGSSPDSVAVGDFDDDGDLDLAVANSTSNNVSVLLGTGTGSFGAAVNLPAGTNPTGVAVGDFDGDGNLDLAVANSNGGGMSVFLGDGAGGFAAAVNFVTSSGPNSAAVGDFNLDGKPDLAIIDSNTNRVLILLNNCVAAVTTFTVNSTNDVDDTVCNAAHCSLREAINASNALAGATDTIAFNIAGAGVHTISPTTALPTITDPVIIDGYTQPGSSANTLAVGNDAVLLIELDGTGAGGADGLVFNVGSSTMRGLVINRFANGIEFTTGDGHTVEGCFIGTDPTGSIDRGNFADGVNIVSGNGTVIGGTTPASRNVISGNEDIGIEDHGTNAIIQGNYIGLNAGGTASALGNVTEGIRIFGTGNTIGGTAAGAGNVISGNGNVGISVGGDSNTVQGNFIGTDAAGTAAVTGSFVQIEGIRLQGNNNTVGGNVAAERNVISGAASTGIDVTGTGNTIAGNFIGVGSDGTTAVPNSFAGVAVGAGPNTVGGTAAGAGNRIAFTIGDGVAVQAGATGVAILGNSIFSNGSTGGDLGIDLSGDGVTANDAGDGDTGANNLQNFPVLTSSTSNGANTTVTGTLNSTASRTFRLEFFSNPTCDASGNGEGQTFLGTINVATDGSGNTTFNPGSLASVAVGQFVTATATDLTTNDSSEFSACQTVAAGPASTGCATPTFGAATNFSTADLPQSVTVGDFNLDGKPDMATANFVSDDVSVLLGNGAGSFGAAANFGTATAPINITTGDFNLDGKPDLVTASFAVANNVSVLLGDGTGNFGAATIFSAGTRPVAVAVGDLNSDGKPDLAVANRDSDTVSVFLGNGTGGFGAATNFGTGSQPHSIAVGDYNLDGKPDLAVANRASSDVSILLGNGAGSFGAATNFTVGSSPRSVAAGDFNLDGRLDLATASNFGTTVSVILNNGAGSFGAATNFTVGNNPVSVAVGDFNQDGRPDLVTANFDDNNASVLLGNGAGSFGAATNFVTANEPSGVAAGDFNLDGRPDFVTANGTPNNVSILLNTCNGSPCGGAAFAAGTNFTTGSAPASVVEADLNNDGKRDIATANLGSDDVSVLLGNGAGSFGAAATFSAGAGVFGLAAGDFNLDGKTDLATANFSSQDVSVLLGNGTGSFAAAVNFAAGDGANQVTAGDFNRDGKPDLVTSNFNNDNVSLLLGDGTGNFAAPTNFSVGNRPLSVTSGDLNQDGKLDLVVTNGGTSNNMSVLLGDGAGSFGAATNFAVGNQPQEAVIGDFNLDGKNDIAVAAQNSNFIAVFLGNGTGAFDVPATFPPGTGTSPGAITVGDFNRDGKPDLATANFDSNDVSILLGNGAGSFTATNFPAGNGNEAIVAADFNGDGKTDLVTGNLNVSDATVLLNNCISAPVINPGTATLTAESCPPANTVLDPGENVTVNFCVTNTGGNDSTALTGTLNATGGVTNPGAAQNYGVVTTGGAAVCRAFTFTVNPALTCGAPLTASIAFQDGATNLGTVNYDLQTGVATLGAAATTSYTGPPVPVPDADSGGVDIPLVVSGVTGTINDLNFRLDAGPGTCDTSVGNPDASMDHTFNSDLRFVLISPLGTTVQLITDRGGSGDNFCTVLLDDDGGFPAASTIPNTGAVAGNFAPESPLSVFDGENPNGTWKLHMVDTAGADTGSLRRYSLIITPQTFVCSSCSAATLTVNSDNDVNDGTCDATHCSLREAINASNASTGTTDTIAFNIAGAGVHTIAPTSALPIITDPVVIDGYTQPGASANTLAVGNDALLLIELDGTGAGAATNGLRITSGGSTVRGLVINRFNGEGIQLQTGGSNVIQGCFIGTNAAGAAASANGRSGVTMSTSANNLIGGTTPGARNVISGSGLAGSLFDGIGISFNTSTGNLIQGNYIGTNAAGTAAIPNGDSGVDMDNDATGNTVGGAAAGASNLIAFNTLDGVKLERENGSGNAVLSNSIHSNGTTAQHLGIDLGADGVTANDAGDADTGPNNLQNFPVITSTQSNGANTIVQATFNSTPSTTGFRIEFFANAACDAAGNGEGARFLGATTVNTDGSGNATINPTLPSATAAGEFVTATATDPSNNTSEFSQCATVTSTSIATLGNYANTSVQLGANTTITPDAAPTNTTSINVSTSTNFKGKLEGNPTTGIVRVTDAHPAGVYTVTVTAFDSGGLPTTKTFTLTVTTPATCNPVTFAAAANFSAGTSHISVAVGDFNGDGKQDLAVANANSNNVSIFLGDGAGNFGAATNFAAGSFPFSVAVGDFNGDGNQDLALANGVSDNVSVLLGNGVGSFSAASNFGAGDNPRSVAVGDFNSDGKQDVATANFDSNNVSVLLGDGAGSFSAATNFGAGNQPRSVAVGDFNGDGKQDLAVANFGSDTVSIFLGNGAGSFGAASNFAVGSQPHSVAVGDFNGDSKQDLAVANSGTPTNASVLLGDGAGSFSAATNLSVGGQPLSVAVGDFNGDDKQDLAVANTGTSPNVSILLGDGTGSFSAATNFGLGSNAQSVAVGDFNGDGKQDLAGANVSNVSVLIRQCPVANTLAVTNPNDSGAGSLRQAILDSNATLGTTETIAFSIPGAGVQTIQPLTELPTITDPVVIDGATQPGFAGTPLIELNGTNAGATSNGLSITAGNSTVRGLAINGFGPGGASGGVGVQLQTGGGNVVEGCFLGITPEGAAAPNNFDGVSINASNNNRVGGTAVSQRNVISGNNRFGVFAVNVSTNNTIVGNFIGTNVAGNAAIANVIGVLLSGDSPNNTVGGVVAGAGNVVSGNTSNGLFLGSGGNVVQGNLVGTTAAGTAALGNGASGVAVVGSSNNTIGGVTAAARNVVSGNTGDGVEISDASATNNSVVGNFIGTSSSGAAAIPNTGHGVEIVTGSNNTVGGATAGASNVIANNLLAGVLVDTGAGNSVLANQIFANGGLGIDLAPAGVTPNDGAGDADTGSNKLQNFPALTSVIAGASTVIQGTLNSTASTSFRLEFFSNAACDASGNGEGRTFLGSTNVTTDGSGNAAFNTTLLTATAVGDAITATATSDPAAVDPNNTSEFSSCFLAAAPSAGTVEFDQTNYAANENAGTVTLMVTRTGGSAGAVTVAFTDTPETATTPADYTNGSGTVSFANGDSTPKPVTIDINNDALDEFDESFTVALSIMSGTATVGVPGTATVTITDDDALPTVSVNDAAVTEGDSGTQHMTFSVSLSAVSGKNVDVNFITADQSANAGSDYDFGTATVTILAGASSANFNVVIRGDTTPETNETFFVNLSAPVNATINDGQGVGTINDNDTALVQITGRVADSANNGILGINVALTGSQQTNTTTDAAGNYSFTNLGAGGNYTVTPSEVNYIFTPQNRAFSSLVTNQIADFTGTFTTITISGRFTDANNLGLAGVTVTVSGAFSLVTESDVNGNYALLNVPASSTFTVTPDLTGYSFSPSSRQFDNVTSSQPNSDFSGVIQPSPTPELDPTDDFNVPGLDSDRWRMGVLSQPPSSFDPLVLLGEPLGQLEITPRVGANGPSFNGYISLVAVDLNVRPVVAVEIIQPATGAGAQTIFGLGSSSNFFFRFLVEEAPGTPFRPDEIGDASATATPSPSPSASPTLAFQVNLNGSKFSSGVGFNPIQHRHWRFRYDSPAQKVYLETSPDFIVWTIRAEADLARDNTRLIAELSGGTFASLQNGTQSIFDNYFVSPPTRLQYGASGFTAPEQGGVFIVNVTRTGETASPSTVIYSTADGTAIAGTDYIATSGTLRFEIGETLKTFQIPILDDATLEGAKTINLTLSDIAGGAVGLNGNVVLTISDDESGTNPIDDSAFFVRQHYRDFLNREPDAAGLAFWIDQIESCGLDTQCREVRRINVSAAFFLSIEFQRTGFLVYRFYDASFNRFPLFSEFLPDTQTIGQGLVVGEPGFEQQLQANERAFANAWVNRPAFRQRYDSLNSANYVDALYANMGITPTEEERTALIAELVTGRETRASVLLKVVREPEFVSIETNRAFVLMQYLGYLRRDADPPGYNFWLQKLNQFNGNFVDAEMVKAFIVSGEYRHRFGP